METIISAIDFANAKKGDTITDANGGIWKFADRETEVGPPPSLVERYLIPPDRNENEMEPIIYSTLFGKNNLIDEELAIMIELNSGKEKINA